MGTDEAATLSSPTTLEALDVEREYGRLSGRKTGGRRVDSPVGVPSGVHVVVGDVDGGVSGEVARVRDRPVGRVAEPVDADSTKVGEAARAEVKLRDSKRTRLHLYTQNTHDVNLIAIRLLPELK